MKLCRRRRGALVLLLFIPIAIFLITVDGPEVFSGAFNEPRPPAPAVHDAVRGQKPQNLTAKERAAHDKEQLNHVFYQEPAIFKVREHKDVPHESVEEETEEGVNEKDEDDDKQTPQVSQEPAFPFQRIVNKIEMTDIHSPDRIVKHPYFRPNLTNDYAFQDKVISEPSPRCGGANGVLVVLLSFMKSSLYRNAIRETWGSVATNEYGPLNSTNGWPGNKTLSMEVTRIFVVGNPGTGDPIKDAIAVSNVQEEAKNFNDILWIDVDESFKNVTRKVLLALTWAQQACPKAKYVMKLDQDVFPNLPLITSFLKYRGQANAIFGFFYQNALHSPVIRGGQQWSVSKKEYPLDRYPIYASGNCYIISADAIAKLTKTYRHFQPLVVEDAFITGILPVVADIKQIHVRGFPPHYEGKPPLCDYVNDNRLTGNMFLGTDLRTYWKNMTLGIGHCLLNKM